MEINETTLVLAAHINRVVEAKKVSNLMLHETSIRNLADVLADIPNPTAILREMEAGNQQLI